LTIKAPTTNEGNMTNITTQALINITQEPVVLINEKPIVVITDEVYSKKHIKRVPNIL
jgi:hypothetical protein